MRLQPVFIVFCFSQLYPSTNVGGSVILTLFLKSLALSHSSTNSVFSQLY